MDGDQDTVIVFGTPLEPLDDDELPSKKPIQVQDQKVYDENGLQRFHGAFTGGFSAGYFNTVGTKEGWTPSEFVSSRSQKAERSLKRPEDFMDAEDLREFGIAPKRIQTKEQFRNETRQPSRSLENAPQVIPGTAPLLDIVKPVSSSVGVILLRKLGWRPGKGVGPKKQIANQDKMYGCALPPGDNVHVAFSTVTVSPNDVDVLSYEIKNNVNGLGYTPLKGSDTLLVSSLFSEKVTGHVNIGRSKKKVAFSGQAFGVGAFEDDDEDIYVKDDLAKYDFTLEEEQVVTLNQKRLKHNKPSVFGEASLTGFVSSSQELSFNKKHFAPPDLPSGYMPKCTSVPVPPSQPVGGGRFLNRFAFCAVDRKKLLGSRFEELNKTKEHPGIKHPLAQCNEVTEKYDTKVKIISPSSNEINQNKKILSPATSYSSVLSTKFIRSSVLESEDISYGLSRPSISSSAPIVEPSNKPTNREHKCQRLIEVWHPVSLLCKRFNVPNPFPEAEEINMAAIAAKKPSFKQSIFRSLFQVPTTVPDDVKEINGESTQSLPDSKQLEELDNTETEVSTTEQPSEPLISERIRTEEATSKMPTNDEALKPPTPPTMDLFNEIFKDTSDELSEHSEDDKDTKEDDPVPSSSSSSVAPLNSSSTSEVPITSPSIIPDTVFYGPALPPVSGTPVSASTFPTNSFKQEFKHSKHKSKKRKSHHKSHKKHNRKKMKRSKVSSDESSNDKETDSESGFDGKDGDDISISLINRLKQMSKSKFKK